jgi:hypothetical protein
VRNGNLTNVIIGTGWAVDLHGSDDTIAVLDCIVGMIPRRSVLQQLVNIAIPTFIPGLPGMYRFLCHREPEDTQLSRERRLGCLY